MFAIFAAIYVIPKERLPAEQEAVTSEISEDMLEEREQQEALPSEQLVIASEPNLASQEPARVEVQVM